MEFKFGRLPAVTIAATENSTDIIAAFGFRNDVDLSFI